MPHRPILLVTGLVAAAVCATIVAASGAKAAGPTPVRPEFSRPGGMPGTARATLLSSPYLLAPAQPEPAKRPRKRRR